MVLIQDTELVRLTKQIHDLLREIDAAKGQAAKTMKLMAMLKELEHKKDQRQRQCLEELYTKQKDADKKERVPKIAKSAKVKKPVQVIVDKGRVRKQYKLFEFQNEKVGTKTNK